MTGSDNSDFTIGVEEEFFLVDEHSLALRPRGQAVVSAAKESLAGNVMVEMSASQAEVATDVCTDLASLDADLRRLRNGLAEVARTLDTRIVAIGSHPFASWTGQGLTDGPRNVQIEAQYRMFAWEQLISGCHVHVGLSSRDLALEVMVRVRPWLQVFMALFGNSPFWRGVDTGYTSYRSEMFGRWPTAGMPPPIADLNEFEALLDDFEASGMGDESFLWWDVRPSRKFPTLEFRVADVCSSLDETVAYAALTRALVERFVGDIMEGKDRRPCKEHLFRIARWRGARYGLHGDLIDLESAKLVDAEVLVGRMMELVAPVLERRGESEFVENVVNRIVNDGNGADRQREVFARTGDLQSVLRAVADETVGHSAD